MDAEDDGAGEQQEREQGHPAPHDDPDKPVPWQGFTSKGPTRLGDNVWCGANVVITSGVTIGDRCVIGANSVVTTDLPAYSIAAGVPARVLRSVEYPAAGFAR